MARSGGYILRINSPRGSRIYRLSPGPTVIGSAPSADVYLPDSRVTGVHAQIDLSDSEILITDLSSRNGTYLDNVQEGLGSASGTDEPFKLLPGVAYKLEPGDRILVGLTELWLDRDQGFAWRQAASIAIITEPEPPVMRRSWYAGVTPPGLSQRSLRLLDFLPEVYRAGTTLDVSHQNAMNAASPPGDFLDRFLALFESVLLPIEWLVDNFDFFLTPRTAPEEFLPWLEDWYGLDFASVLDPSRRRNLLLNAHRLFSLKGTRTALVEAVELVSGCVVEVDDLTTQGAHFIVTVWHREGDPPDRELLNQLIETFKPVNTTHQLVITASAQTTSH